MIIQSLIDGFEALKKAKVIRFGWENIKVSYGLDLNADGTVAMVVDLCEQSESGKKIPSLCEVPARASRGNIIAPNAFCDNSKYVLGYATNKDELPTDRDILRTKRCFEAMGNIHKELLASCTSPAAEAAMLFFCVNTPESLRANPVIQPYYADMVYDAAKYIILMYGGAPISEYDDIAAAWDSYFQQADEPKGKPNAISCVSGKPCIVRDIHPNIRGLKGGLPSGNLLCACNLDSCRQYGKDQGYNFPMSYSEATAYTGCLNYLIANQNLHASYDNLTLCIYSRTSGLMERYGKFVRACLGANKDTPVDDNVLRKLALGRSIMWDGDELEPQMTLSLLMLVPNYARIAVIDYRELTVEEIAKHTMRYRINTYSSSGPGPSAGAIVYHAVRRESKTACAEVNVIKGAILAVIAGESLPCVVAQSIVMQIRNGDSITPDKAKIISLAMSEKNGGYIMSALNEANRTPGYLVGRMLAVCDSAEYSAYVSQKSRPAPLLERYRTQVFTRPKRAIGVVNERMLEIGKVLRAKGKDGAATYYEKQFATLMELVTPEELAAWPNSFSLDDQAMVVLGFSHQREEFIEESVARKEARLNSAENEDDIEAPEEN